MKQKEPMTPQEFADEMRRIWANGDPESAHIEADDLMLSVLETLGYGEGGKIFNNENKWYA